MGSHSLLQGSSLPRDWTLVSCIAESLQSEPLGKHCCFLLLLFSLLNRVQSWWPHGLQPSLSFIISRSLLKLASIESALPSNHLVLCHPFFLPSIFSHQGLFTVSWLFESGGQSIGALASASVLPMNIQCWFLLGLTGLISLLSKGLSQESSALGLFYFPALTSVHDYRKNHSFDYTNKVMFVTYCVFFEAYTFLLDNNSGTEFSTTMLRM